LKERQERTPMKYFLDYGPTLEQLGISIGKSMDGMAKSTDGAVESFALWHLQIQKATFDDLPFIRTINMMPAVLSKTDAKFQVVTAHLSKMEQAERSLRTITDGL